ncbi:MAG: arginase family protein [Candidatus Aminicenantia bacterium]
MKGTLLINKNDILIIGLPFDSNSSLTYGCSLAPDAIRTFIKSGSSSWSTESGIDISKTDRDKDLGNLKITSYLSIEDEFVKLLKRDVKIVTIGGDHSITFPILKAFSKYYKDIEILHIDAHPDLYEKFQDSPYSHACLF